MSTSVTDQLLSISRNLADTTQRSAETLETLGNYFFLLTKKMVFNYVKLACSKPSLVEIFSSTYIFNSQIPPHIAANSSTSVHSTRDELLTTSSVIQQSGTLLAKYGRRELTDKVLLFFAFAFFFACVLYIVHKRLF